MRKICIAILAFVYILVSSGITITNHYCMGRLASVAFLKHADKCRKCGMKNNTGCCKDEFKIFKLQDSHKLISGGINIFTPVAVIENSTNSPVYAHYFSSRIQGFANHSPPPPPALSLNISNCVFRI